MIHLEGLLLMSTPVGLLCPSFVEISDFGYTITDTIHCYWPYMGRSPKATSHDWASLDKLVDITCPVDTLMTVGCEYPHWNIVSNEHSLKSGDAYIRQGTGSSFMMTSSNGNIFRVTGPLCGEFTGHRWIPSTKASDAELWCFLWSAPWINGCANNREAGDLRRHRVHYDVIVMCLGNCMMFNTRPTITWSNNRFCQRDPGEQTLVKFEPK